jgi:transcriptional regulator with XRE-family HTH domain
LAEKLAARTGRDRIDPTTITRLEAGKRPITVNELVALASIFGVSVEDLTSGGDQVAGIAEFREAVQEMYRGLAEVQRAHREFDKSRGVVRDIVDRHPELARLGKEFEEVGMAIRANPQQLLGIPPF